MNQLLKQIYLDLSEGRLAPQAALEKIKALKLRGSEQGRDALLAVPVWQASAAVSSKGGHEYVEWHVVLCEFAQPDVEALQQLLPGARCVALQAAPSQNIAERYSDHALACFESLKAVLQNKPRGKVLWQMVVAPEQERAVLAGLSGLLKAAMAENPQLIGQLILVTAQSTLQLARLLEQNTGARDTVVKHEQGGRQTLTWQALPAQELPEPPIAFRDRGVYLITGGRGGLGRLVAKEILQQTSHATIVLTGRSTPNQATDAAVNGLGARAGQVHYRQLDIEDAAQVAQLVAAMEKDHGRLNGILHSAGMIADSFILSKSSAEFRRVLAPKVTGTFNLDSATREVDLDFFVLFSSIASAMGNLGQADYAAANGFMDAFAAYRNRLASAGERSGRTLSINWSSWIEGGMRLDDSRQEQLRRTTGLEPLLTSTAFRALYQSLQSSCDQVLVMQGNRARLHRMLAEQTMQPASEPLLEMPEQFIVRATTDDARSLAERTADYLCKQLSVLLKLPPHRIDPQAALEKYGIDSILAVSLITQLEKTFGPLSKTLLFEYQTLQGLAGYLIQSHAARLAQLFAVTGASKGGAVPSTQPPQPLPSTQRVQKASRRFAGRRTTFPERVEADPIAIVGVSGRYPEAPDVDAYWRNLRDGKDCITEVPRDRWDWRDYFSEDRTRGGHHYSKWGGFIAGVDEFDPLFFNISPKEAKHIDPQERLFLQHAWMAIEDAGFTRESLRGLDGEELAGQVGVYVGAMYSEYQLFGVEASMRGHRMGVAGSFASIANRVSYALNLHGPSMTLDTMCSSSLTAIHIACQDLLQGRTRVAIAGGVNVSIHPNKYLVLSAGQFISSDGHCQSFGEGGDGYIPGEGVGVVILKRLAEAERDGHPIYGVIRGTALNHGGKTNGYTVPNPQAQADVIRRALAAARVPARHVSYVEAHGTGTKLGDPIEIAALTKAFHGSTPASAVAADFCAIGSAKSNIGHCESAAGIAGLTKVLLQMKHRLIVPSLHSTKLNPHIDFAQTPFIVNQTLRPWERLEVDGQRVPRIAGISSFGAGGSNAHVIVEEYQPAEAAWARGQIVEGPAIVLLSARTAEQLLQKARDLLAFIERDAGTDHSVDLAINLASLAYTLQVGREAMDERVGFLVDSIEALAEKLRRFLADTTAEHIDDIYRGQARRHKETLSWFSTDVDFQKTVEHWFADGKLAKLLDAWVKGLPLDWQKLFAGRSKPRLMSLPAYPFAKERYWIELAPPIAEKAVRGPAALHPLVHTNTSNLAESSYASTFAGTEAFLETDAITGEKLLPELAGVEMMRVAVELASPPRSEPGRWEIHNVVWGSPMVIAAGRPLRTVLLARNNEQVDVEIFSREGADDSSGEIVHCQGRAMFCQDAVPAPLDVASVAAPTAVERTGVRADASPGAKVEASRREIALPALSSQVALLDELRIDLPPKPVKVVLAAIDEWTAPASAATVKVTLRQVTSDDLPSVGVATGSSLVQLFDLGRGVFSIELRSEAGVATQSARWIESLSGALNRAREESSLKVLLVNGTEHEFWPGDRSACNRAIERRLLSDIAAFPYPVIAVMRADAHGLGFLLGAVCDLMVCSEEARYGYTDFRQAIFPSASEERFFRERLGEVAADDFLYQPTPLTGRQLKQKGWRCRIVPAARTAAEASELAAALAQKPQAALRLLKAHLARDLVPLVDALTVIDEALLAARVDETSAGISCPTGRLELEVHEAGILVVTLVAEPQCAVADWVADLRSVFEQIDRSSSCKAVVLASRHPGFLPRSATEFANDLKQLVQGCRIPVIAAFTGNAAGLAWWLGQWCEARVYHSQGHYCVDDGGIASRLAPEIAALFVRRLGASLGQEVCLTAHSYSGLDLQSRSGALTVVGQAEVMQQALRRAAFWCSWPQGVITEWKRARSGALESSFDEHPGPENWNPEETVTATPTVVAGNAPTSITLRSSVVSLTAHRDGVVEISLHDRQAKNLFSEALVEGLKEAFAHVAQTPAYKVIVLSGYDSYFVAGGTRETLLAIQEGRAQFTDEKAFQLPMDCPLPVIAAMQGHGVGGGWSFGMFADVILFSEESHYVSPYMGYGFTPGAGSTLVFPRKIGYDLARETLLTANELSGRELHERGLPFAVLPRRDVVPAAMELARRMARQPREQLMSLKRQWTHALRQSRDDVYRREVQMHEHTFVGQADALQRIQASFPHAGTPQDRDVSRSEATNASAITRVELASVMERLRTLLAQELHLGPGDIDEGAQFIDLGLDSLTGVTWMRKVNEHYGTSIEATKVYSHPTLAALARYVKEEAEQTATPASSNVPAHAATEQLTDHRSAEMPSLQVVAQPSLAALGSTRDRLASWRSQARSRLAVDGGKNDERIWQPIAVVGMAGQFPQAGNVEQFWENIAQGKDCITEVPAGRWDIDAFYQPGEAVPGKTNSRWMGALKEYDRFDPLFFNISPTEAHSMDPQQRLFLQTCWHSIEDAGYSAKALSGSRCGVFVGCAQGDYHQLSEEQRLSAQGFTGAASSILAARISYFLNLQGPCVAVDTACSSSLVAMAQACDSLSAGHCDAALVGGVYAMAGPDMHIKTAQAGMLSTDGRCFTWDQRANGFVPGEAVGVVMLKRLADAERDQDIIYGVIEGWGVNQDGRTNGITAPNPESQTRLQQEVYDRYRIDPSHIQLVEAHGTGTKLGDPIEVEGLKNSFGKYTRQREYCALGSVKSNIGHCLTAAGIASVIKVLLALKHRQLPPSVNFERLNEHIGLEGSPFYVNRRLQPWSVEPAVRRRGAVSSFGFSGTNAHVVIGEYAPPTHANTQAAIAAPSLSAMVPLSARTPEQLRDKARDLLRWIEKTPGIDLASMACTLQLGREAMEERLGFIVSSVDEFTQKLRAYISGTQEIPGCYQGQVKRNREGLRLITQDAELMAAIVGNWIAERKLSNLLDLWVKGLALDWNALYGPNKPRRIRLPTYPFAKERYWIETSTRVTVAIDADESDGLAQAEPGVVRAEPVWEVSASEPEQARVFGQRHILLCGLDEVEAAEVQRRLGASHCEHLLISTAQPLAERYSAYAVGCFERIQGILRSKFSGEVLLQVVVIEGTQERSVLGGLSGLLKTASLENPQLVCQLIQMSGPRTSAELAQRLEKESGCTAERVIRYEAGVRQVQRWRLHSPAQGAVPAVPLGWKDDGIYLITGGLGGLGKLFVQEILQQTRHAKVIVAGRSALSETSRSELQQLCADGTRLEYRVMDVSDAQQVCAQINAIQRDYGALHGILHSAGVIADNFIVKKTAAELGAVFGPKVQGTLNLDEASREIALDFLVLFSSVAAALGNVGQADYAAANGFMDEYARYRNDLVARGERCGKTVSINWPLWATGGMRIDEASAAQLAELTGMRPMRTSTGIGAFHESLQSAYSQWLVMEGEVEKLQRTLRAGGPVQEASSLPSNPEAHQPVDVDPRWLRDRMLQKLRHLLGEVFQLSHEKIDVQEELSSYGLDSILVTKLNQKLAHIFGNIPKTLFFEYQTLDSLAPYLVREYPAQCLSWTGAYRQPYAAKPSAMRQETSQETNKANRSAAPSPARRARQQRPVDTATAGVHSEPIAIIGISGLYPQAATLDEYWANLKAGKDCIGEIPARRWSLGGFYHPNAIEAVRQGKSYCKWGAFVEQFDRFDAFFFGISPRDAINMDPQERLFLQAAWHALEDSGYTRSDLQNKFGRRAGVFAGITKTGFNLHGGHSSRAEDQFHPHTSFSSVANRLSYFMDITGPSMPIDTMCSSSLTAIHEACEHIRRGECDLAFAGGVNLYLHPATYIDMSTQYVLSKDGVCRSFGAGANGFVPGEGVGVVLLKPLAAAVADNDVIHGLILATHVNHGGKTNGYTVPSPKAQAELIRRAIDKAGISARDISYVEAHGTGTELGDPIEIEGLQRAFQQDTREIGYCRIGSAKSNIGHLEAAAGIAGLTKVLLQMKHGEIAPSMHAEQVNPNIAFESTPFVLNRALRPWESQGADGKSAPRIAGISSFGAGGANAHVIVKEHRVSAEEYRDSADAPAPADDEPPRVAVPLSARTVDQLREKARDLLNFMRAERLGKQRTPEVATSFRAPSLVEIAYTLQVGREAMEQRVGFIVSSFQELEAKLDGFVSGQKDIEDAYQGQVKGANEDLALIGQDEDMQAVVDKWIASRKLSRMLELWVRGLKLDWSRLYGDARPRRVSLPVYPFADERYWLPAPAPAREREVRFDVVRNLASIEALIGQIDADSIDTPLAAEMLNALVR